MPKPTFLDNPLLQGALGAYFNAISTPRREGIGGAIGHGGLGGLQAYSAARSAQLTPYLTAAKLGLTQAQTQAAQARGGLDTAKTQALPAQMDALNNLRKAAARLSNIKADDQPGLDAARQDLDKAQAAYDQARGREVPSQINKNIAQTGEAGAAATKDIAQAGEAKQVGAKAAVEAKEAPKRTFIEQEKADKAGLPKPESPDVKAKNIAATQKIYGDQYDKNHPMARYASPSYAKDKAAYIQQQMTMQPPAGPAPPPGGSADTSTIPAPVLGAMKAHGLTPTGERYPNGDYHVKDAAGNDYSYPP